MTHASDIEEQAALWLARRDSQRSFDESGEFAAWLAADARHRAAYLRLAAAWERSARLKTLRPEGGQINADLLQPRSTSDRWIRWPPLALAATVVTVAVAMTWWALTNLSVETYRTEIGGLSRVVLGDGSTVTLNTDTELRVRLGKARREVQLLRGEAQFIVAHDPSRPFEVSAGGKLVRAIGTAFDVRLDEDKALEVIVTEGRVVFVDAAASAEIAGLPPTPATISAGERARAGGGKLIVHSLSATEASRQLAWQVGELSFQGETLAEAVAEFNRYNRGKLKVNDHSISNLQIGGNFRALDTESFVAALRRSFGITATRAADGTLLLDRATDPQAE